MSRHDCKNCRMGRKTLTQTSKQNLQSQRRNVQNIKLHRPPSYKTFLCSTQLSMKFQLLIKTNNAEKY